MEKRSLLELKPEPWVKAEEAAKHLGLSKDQVNKMARESKLPGHNVGMGSKRYWRFRISEIDATMEKMNSPDPIFKTR